MTLLCMARYKLARLGFEALRAVVHPRTSIEHEAGACRLYLTDPSRISHHYSVTVTGVPTGAFSKKLLAIRPGKRMQPWDAANGGT
jgi:hypothetical protein